MSWYDKESVTCRQCNLRFSTPIDRMNHKRNCRVKRNPDGTLNFSGMGTGVIEKLQVVRGRIEEGNRIVVEFGGKNVMVKVVSIFDSEILVCLVKKQNG